MKFGENIRRQREQDVHWGPHYLHYDDLKGLLERSVTTTSSSSVVGEQQDDKENGFSMSMPPYHTKIDDTTRRRAVVTEEFSRLLYHEMERIVLFVYEQQGKIAADLASYHRTIQQQQQQQQQQARNLGVTAGSTSQPDGVVNLPSDLLATSSQHASAAGLFIDEASVVGGGDADKRLVPIHDLARSQQDLAPLTPNTSQEGANSPSLVLSELSRHYCETGRAIILLYQFVDVNVTGIRKILKKHDKIMGHGTTTTTSLSEQFLTPPTYNFLMKRLGGSFHGSSSSPRLGGGGYGSSTVSFGSPSLSQDHPSFARAGSQMIQPLLHEDYLGALVVALESGVRALVLLEQEATAGPPFRRSMSAAPPPPSSSDRLQSRSFNELANMRSSSSLSPKTMMTSQQRYQRKGFRNSSASLSTHDYLPPSDVDVMLSQVRAAQRRLRQQTSHFVHFLAAPMMVVARQGSSDFEDHEHDEPLAMLLSPDEMDEEDQSRISNWLNLLSTVFFMTNYYIVAPTSGNYAHLLGGNAALASLIVGMTPLAALFSTVLYSWWTSYSYKHALIFASVCSTVGNLFYAAGLPCDSLTLVLIGRLLNGFGSARSINRRYIADTFSRADRTAASAAFVTAGAMGMAAGPLLASLLHMVVVRLPNNEHNLYVQSENAPGWFMFFVWAIYLVCLIIYFKDPPRNADNHEQATKRNDSTETSPLLTGKAEDGATARHDHETPSSKKQQERQSSSLWTNVPVMVTLFICAVLKLQNEAVLCAAANLAKFYFSWTPSFVGLYLASLGLMMLPANLIVGYYARRHEDRDLIVALLVIMVLGGCLMLNYTGRYGVAQYMVASFVLFVASTALEGPNMSLLSKSIPASWSRGVFNVGLLATESGTFGRTVADALLTLFGADGIDHLLNRTFVSATLISIAALFVCYRCFDRLRSLDREEH